MTKHIIIWKLKEEFSAQDKAIAKAQAKEKLEGLIHKIDGILKIEVITEILDSSANADMMLYSEFRDEAALEFYQTHPDHIEAAKYVRSVVSTRSCVDYNE